MPNRIDDLSGRQLASWWVCPQLSIGDPGPARYNFDSLPDCCLQGLLVPLLVCLAGSLPAAERVHSCLQVTLHQDKAVTAYLTVASRACLYHSWSVWQAACQLVIVFTAACRSPCTRYLQLWQLTWLLPPGLACTATDLSGRQLASWWLCPQLSIGDPGPARYNFDSLPDCCPQGLLVPLLICLAGSLPAAERVHSCLQVTLDQVQLR